MPEKKERGIYGQILAVGMPLVVSMSSTTVMEFTDRLFLGWYSLDAIAAATPAAFLALLCVTVFFGTGGYVSVFVAQYVGSKQPEKVGAVLWQGLYLTGIATLFTSCFSFFLPEIFAFVGHSISVQHLEVVYCRVLCLGAGMQVAGIVLSAFFSGQGKTRMVMAANITGMTLNIPLNYALINGLGPFPELGIVGAGLATVAGWTAIAVILAARTFTKKNETCFCVRSAYAFSKDLFGRLLYYGAPGGGIFFLELFSFTAFILAVGKIGTVELAASNIALTINSIAFLPLVGFSTAASVLTGQAIGGKKVETVPDILRCTLSLTTGYLMFLGLLFLFWPEIFISIFQLGQPLDADFEQVTRLSKVMLRFVVFYLFFDGLTYSVYGVLKGAGDTWFVMASQVVCAGLAMLLPLWIGLHLGLGVYFLWACVCFYIISLGLSALYRYRQGKWRFLRVVET